METTHSLYDFNKSISNFDEILNSSDSNYLSHNGIPNKNNLTFTNCKNRSKPDTNVGVRPDAKTEFNRTVKRS